MVTKASVKRKPDSARAKPASEEEGHDELEVVEKDTSDSPDPAGLEVVRKDTSDSPKPAEAEMNVAASAPSRPRSGTRKRPVMTETIRDLERMNKELQVRIRELELELAGGARQGKGKVAEYVEVSEESSSIIAMVKDLHGEIDVAYELKEALEADLAALKKKLSEEETVRAELEARVNLLEAKAALGDQLREDISFVEEERNETARRFEEATAKLAQLSREHSSLAEQKAVDETRLMELQRDKIGLEAKVLNLEDTVAEMDQLRRELAEERESSQLQEENKQNIKGKLEATEISKNALELDVATTREIVRSQNEQIEELRDDLANAHAGLADLRAKLDVQEVENVNLRESYKRVEREIKTLSARNESMKNELDLSKKALRDIRTAAVRTSGRVRERYSGA